MERDTVFMDWKIHAKVLVFSKLFIHPTQSRFNPHQAVLWRLRTDKLSFKNHDVLCAHLFLLLNGYTVLSTDV